MWNVIKQSKLPILAGVILLGIDSLTKWIANISLPVEQPVNTVLPFWKWYLTYNEGYHYIFGEIGNFRLIQMVGLVAVIVLIYLMAKQRTTVPREQSHYKLFGVFIALLIGATGNPFETLLLGRVTDFFIFTPLPWPSNIADQYINLAIYVCIPLWLIFSFRELRREKRKAEQGMDPPAVESEESS